MVHGHVVKIKEGLVDPLLIAAQYTTHVAYVQLKKNFKLKVSKELEKRYTESKEKATVHYEGWLKGPVCTI